MPQLKSLGVEEVSKILDSGEFQRFLNTLEHGSVECKKVLYRLGEALEKIELAKDVSALAHVKGGFILLGLETEANLKYQADEIVKVCCFKRESFPIQQYRDVLSAKIYPPIPELKITWHPSLQNPEEGLGAIYVSPESCREQPHLVSESIVGGKITGKLVGFFERIDAGSPSFSVHKLRDRLKDGTRFDELSTKIENILALISQNRAPSVENDFRKQIAYGVDNSILERRALDAKAQLDLQDAPSFFIAATPSVSFEFSDIFESRQSRIPSLLTDPPKYRNHGFGFGSLFYDDDKIEMHHGEFWRRSHSGWKSLEVWRDGTVIYIGSSGREHLGWGNGSDDSGLPINNYVLTEIVTLFFKWVIACFRGVANAPSELRVLFSLLGSPRQLESYELSATPITKEFPYMTAGKKYPSKSKVFSIDMQTEGAVEEVEAYRLLKEIYLRFGYTEDQIPYADITKVPRRIDSEAFAG